MMFADVTFSTEGMVVISGLLAALAGTVVFLFRILLAAKEEQIKSYKEIAETSVFNLEIVANKNRSTQGKRPFTKIAPVVGEHNSPETKAQKETAELQTTRARLVAATLDLGLPARVAHKPEDEFMHNPPTFEEVDRLMQAAGFDAAPKVGAAAALPSVDDLKTFYAKFRPALVFVSVWPFMPSAWKAGFVILIRILDGLTGT